MGRVWTSFSPSYILNRTTTALLKDSFGIMLYSLHNSLTLLYKYMSTERWPEFTRVDPNPCDTIKWDTNCIVDNSHYLTGLSANYCLTQFTCICFGYLNICFSIYFFVFPVSFFCQHYNTVDMQLKQRTQTKRCWFCYHLLYIFTNKINLDINIYNSLKPVQNMFFLLWRIESLVLRYYSAYIRKKKRIHIFSKGISTKRNTSSIISLRDCRFFHFSELWILQEF